MAASAYQRAAFAAACSIVGQAQKVTAFYNSDESIRMPIARVADSPDRSLTTFFTAGLGEYPTSWTAESGRPLRFEFLTVAAAGFEGVPEGLSTCANYVASGAARVEPGLVYPEVFDRVFGATSPHGLLWWPFNWARQFATATIEGLDVEWLLVIPITDHERDFVLAKGTGRRGAGTKALIDSFEAQGIDIYDLGRASAILPE